MKKPRQLLTAFMVAGALAVSTLPLHAAVATSSPASPSVNFYSKKQGKLIAQGVAVRVKFDITCEPDIDFYNAEIELLQRRDDGRITRAYRYFNPERLPCDGERHTVPMLVTAQDYAFDKGRALIVIRLDGCDGDYYYCEQFEEVRSIWLKK